MLAFISYVIATVLLIAGANGGEFVTDNPTGWGLVFVALGLALAQLPYGPRWPRNGPQ